MQGVWFEDNGSIVCRWWWDPGNAELLVRCGSASTIEPVAVSPEAAADQGVLGEILKAAALETAQRMI